MSILIRWLRQKPVDMGLQCFQKRISLGTAGQGLITSFQCFVNCCSHHLSLDLPIECQDNTCSFLTA